MSLHWDLSRLQTQVTKLANFSVGCHLNLDTVIWILEFQNRGPVPPGGIITPARSISAIFRNLICSSINRRSHPHTPEASIKTWRKQQPFGGIKALQLTLPELLYTIRKRSFRFYQIEGPSTSPLVAVIQQT